MDSHFQPRSVCWHLRARPPRRERRLLRTLGPSTQLEIQRWPQTCSLSPHQARLAGPQGGRRSCSQEGAPLSRPRSTVRSASPRQDGRCERLGPEPNTGEERVTGVGLRSE